MQKSSYPRKPANRKAQTPAEQLTSAIARATRDHITVAGSGTMADGRRFFIVASQSVDGMHHVVSEHGKSLQCDCLYSTMQGKICVHRAAAYLHLKAVAEATTRAPAMRAVAEAAVQQAAAPAKPAQPAKASAPAATRAEAYRAPAAKPARPAPDRRDTAMPASAGERDFDPLTGMYRTDYVPADYKSHQYR